MSEYKLLFSSDWSECLSPNGPFDPFTFTYPQYGQEFDKIFRAYTGNQITLQTAVTRIKELIPDLLTMEQMDTYLDSEFKSYLNVNRFLEWCSRNDVLVMINTTGTQGYFQRAIEKKLLHPVPFVAASPLLSFELKQKEDRFRYRVTEIEDKGTNTENLAKQFSIPMERVVIMGDSGGDGPHFLWAQRAGVKKIASQAKKSLVSFCDKNGVHIDQRIGMNYDFNMPRSIEMEMIQDFSILTDLLVQYF